MLTSYKLGGEKMNKKDIAEIRRQFKKNNDLLKINEIFNVYVMKESSEIYFQVQPNADVARQLFLGYEFMVDGQRFYGFINTPYELVDSTITILRDQFFYISVIVFVVLVCAIAYFLFLEGKEIFFNSIFPCVGFASSLTKLWL